MRNPNLSFSVIQTNNKLLNKDGDDSRAPCCPH